MTIPKNGVCPQPYRRAGRGFARPAVNRQSAIAVLAGLAKPRPALRKLYRRASQSLDPPYVSESAKRYCCTGGPRKASTRPT